jgi:hypothetical protein
MTDTLHGDPGPSLDRALGRLPLDLPPARDLWPTIAEQLAPVSVDRARAPGRRAWAWQAAAAIALVAVSSLVTAALVRQQPGPRVAQAPSAGLVSGDLQVVPTAFGPTHSLSPEYQAAHRQLSALLQQRIGRMPHSARQKLELNLAELRRAASEINAALAEQPGDPLLEELLLNTYQEELSVLAAANQLTAAGAVGSPPDSTRMQL